jgi:hypothetical protein
MYFVLSVSYAIRGHSRDAAHVRYWPHRDVSLRRTDWVAIGGIADMNGRAASVNSAEIDPLRSESEQTGACNSGNRLSLASAITSSSCLTPLRPTDATMPNSARWAKSVGRIDCARSNPIFLASETVLPFIVARPA